MPELAEVEITREKLLPMLCGRRVLDFWTDWPTGLKIVLPTEMRRDIRGRKIADVLRHGKVLFFKLSGRPERMMAVHLRMSGRLEVKDAVAPAFGGGDRWIHFLWKLSGGKILQFIDPRKFGLVWYGSQKDFSRDPYLDTLGKDAHLISLAEFKKILSSRRGMVKPFLLKQNYISGIGNIIADESLWRAKIHPRTEIPRLTNNQIKNLHRAIQKTIRLILSSGGTSLRNWGHPDGRRGGFQERRLIYAKSGQPCPRCRTKLARLEVGGRGTTICPRCQGIVRN